MKIRNCPWCENKPEIRKVIEFWYVACATVSCPVQPELLRGLFV